MPFFRLAPTAVCAAALSLGACNTSEPEGVPFGPALTLNPASLSLAVGRSETVGVALPGGATAQTRVRWVSSAPAIAVVDSTPRVGKTAGDPVPVRGVSAGATVLNLTVVHEGQTITGTIPVTVQAAP
jgi:uncharacterized protein YjdB